MSYDINEASKQLREVVSQEPVMDLDHLFSTIKDLKSEREKKLKQDFEFQKEATNLRVAARGAGFDVEYDPQTNSIRQTNLQAEEPPRMTVERGVQLEEGELVNYMDRFGLTREQALKNLQGGITTTETGSRVPPKPGAKAQKPVMDAGSEAVMAGYKKGLETKAVQENTPPKPKPLTESQRTAISYQNKITRIIKNLKPLVKKGVGTRTLASAPRSVTTAMKMGKVIPGVGKQIWQNADDAEAFRDYVDQLRASIPFAKGGKALTKEEAARLDVLLAFGPDTSNETIARQLNEFIYEFGELGKLAGGDPLTEEDLLSQAATEDIESLRGKVDSVSSELKSFLEENDLE